MADYALTGQKWGASALGTAGGVITWAVDATISASFLPYITAAFADWSIYANIEFQQVSSTASSQIDLRLGYIDGLNNVLGQANWYYSGSSLVSSAITFDSGEGWHVSGNRVVSNGGADFFIVALHEIGHSIGLDHYNAVPAVMNAYLSPSITELTPSDIHGVQALYGASTPLSDSVLSVAGLAPDINGDGKADIAWWANNGSVAIWNNIDNGTHGGDSLGLVGTNWRIVQTADFGGDGKSDLLWRASNGDVAIWDNIANGSHGGASFGNVGTNWIIEGSGDFGGDGKSDILWRATNGDVVVWDNITGGSHGGASYGNVGLDWKIAATGDFNGDHKSDILWQGNNGEIVAWENLSNGTHGGESFGSSAGSGLHLVAAADFSGDGKADILWRANNGDVFIWQNLSGTSHTTVALGNVGLGWEINNVGDYDGDGKAGILWRANNGDVAIWENIASNGSHGGQSLGNVGLEWDVQVHHYDLV